ncbi:MAG: tetratricopeptide repeat protein, partial [Clostridiales bacterium]|nr:tetratricopeptide repeat protein [Clostridiales bacterium]
AMTWGTTFKEDNASHYKRTADAILRYDKLYMQQNSKESEDKLIREKLSIAKALVTCNEVEACTKFLAETPYKSNDLDVIRAGCLFSLKSYDECLAVVSEMLKTGTPDSQSLYLAAMSALYLKDIKSSIQYALVLSDMVKKAKDPLQAEQLLYPFLLRFSTSDGSARYTSEVYGSMTEDEIALLKSDQFLFDYATALQLWSRGDGESMNNSLAAIDRVLSVRSDLSRAVYVKGAINFELQKNDEAISSYKASLSIDNTQPTVWYALANVYDRAGNYEEAYAACQKVLENLPSTDHASDVYGVSIHASYLLEKLKPLVKEGT